MLQVQLSSYSEKFIKKNQVTNSTLIRKLGLAIKELANNPLSHDCKKLTGYPFYRIRVNNYRIIYRYDKTTLYITLIEKRDKIYSLAKKINKT